LIGKKLKDLGFTQEIILRHVAVKEVVFPFTRFTEVDTVLGPEMKSTGEVMGVDSSFGMAFIKSSIAAGQVLPLGGTIFLSVKDDDKPVLLSAVRKFARPGFKLIATEGIARFFSG
jgi:carbamoyl-phosphate synthase large subunit